MARLRRTLLVTMAALVVTVGAGCTTPTEAAAPAPGPVPATSPAPAPAPAPPAAGQDLRRLLIQPADIPVPDFLPPRAEPLAEEAVQGVVAYYDSAAGERQLGVTIVLLPDPAAAQDAMLGAAEATREQRAGARSDDAAVGDRAVLVTGYELAGTASTLLLFSQGSASVAMEFRTPSSDPIPPDAVVAAGSHQAAQLRSAFG